MCVCVCVCVCVCACVCPPSEAGTGVAKAHVRFASAAPTNVICACWLLRQLCRCGDESRMDIASSRLLYSFHDRLRTTVRTVVLAVWQWWEWWEWWLIYCCFWWFL